MTSYIPQTRYAQRPDKWWSGARYATREEAEARLNDGFGLEGRIETRIIESPLKPNDGVGRKTRDKDDLRHLGYGWRKHGGYRP